MSSNYYLNQASNQAPNQQHQHLGSHQIPNLVPQVPQNQAPQHLAHQYQQRSQNSSVLPNTASQAYANGYDYLYKQALPQVSVSVNTTNNSNQYYNQQYYPRTQDQNTTRTSANDTGAAAVAATESGRKDTYFSALEIQTLKQLLVTGEKHKWKQVTKEINHISSMRSDGSTAKNVSPTFVMKQYQSILGLPSNQTYFGLLGSSLPYVVHGWDAVEEVD